MVEQLSKVAAIGGEWVIWLLAVLSVISLGVIVERWLFFARRKADVEALSDAVLAKLRAGEREQALELLGQQSSIEATVLSRCIEWVDDSPESLAEMFEGALRDQRRFLDQGSTLLSTIGNNAPFIGLFGTVLGVVQAFRELGDAGGANAMGNVMSGISEALIATAAGIFVALPAVAAYNWLGKKANDVEDNARTLMNTLLAHRKSTRISHQLSPADGDAALPQEA